MVVDAPTEQFMTTNVGIVPMETSMGIEALCQSVLSSATQVLVMEGDLKRLTNGLKGVSANKIPYAQKTRILNYQLTRKSHLHASHGYLKRQLATVIRLPVHRIQADEPLEKYGIDSIMVMQLTNELEKTFGSLSKTLFFEYQTLQEISEYFITSHRPQLLKLLKKPEGTSDPNPVKTGPVLPQDPVRLTRRWHRASAQPAQTNGSTVTGPLDIAIIGMSGKYPQSDDLGAYWHNLRDGKDCITEVPKERWNWRNYYTDDHCQVALIIANGVVLSEMWRSFDPFIFQYFPTRGRKDGSSRASISGDRLEGVRRRGILPRSSWNLSGDYLSSQVGVYAGVMYGEYQLYGAEACVLGQPMSLGGSYASIAIAFLMRLICTGRVWRWIRCVRVR